MYSKAAHWARIRQVQLDAELSVSIELTSVIDLLLHASKAYLLSSGWLAPSLSPAGLPLITEVEILGVRSIFFRLGWLLLPCVQCFSARDQRRSEISAGYAHSRLVVCEESLPDSINSEGASQYDGRTRA
jgi:hypothetical protein